MEITNLKTKHWQRKLNTVGEIVTDIEDIEQSLDTILNTPKGSVPFLLNLGTDIIDAIGQSPEKAKQIITTILAKEIPLQEPRAEIVEITTDYDYNGKFEVGVKFKSKLTSEERTKTYYV